MSNLTKEKLIEMFTMLVKLRRLEERVLELALAGGVPGWLHSYMGQEAVAVGVTFRMRRDDYVASTHRGRAHCVAKGVDVKRYMAEVLCRRDGICRGRGGEMHLVDMEVGVAACSGIVGGILSTSLGLAFSSQYRDSDQVTACFFGDGSTNQGTFHECLNLASLWTLPVVFVCDNNGWAEFTPLEASTRVTDIAAKAAAAYGLPGVSVDGDDVLAVYDAAGEAIDRARKGDGPTLLECRTHRWYGHFIGDAQKYRSADEIEECRRFDPVSCLQTKLSEQGMLTTESIAEIEQRVKTEVDEAVDFAQQSPLSDPEELMGDVYYEEEKTK